MRPTTARGPRTRATTRSRRARSRAGPDRRGDGRAANVLFIKNNRAFKFLEPACHLEPEIPDRELDSRVRRIEMPHTLTRAVNCHDHLVTPVILLTGGFASKV